MAERYDLVIIGTAGRSWAASPSWRRVLPLPCSLSIGHHFRRHRRAVQRLQDELHIPIGFPLEYWDPAEADRCLEAVGARLGP